MADGFGSYSLAIMTLASVGHAYQLTNRLFTSETTLRLLEIIPANEGASLLIMGETHHLREFCESVRENEGATPVIVEKHTEPLLKAFYSLETKSLLKHFVVFESEFCGELFSMGEAAIGFGFDIVDLKVPRGGQRSGLIIVTTDHAELVDGLPRFEGSGRSLTIIRERADGFARFFPVT